MELLSLIPAADRKKDFSLLTVFSVILSLCCTICDSHLDLAFLCGNMCSKPSTTLENECLVSCVNLFYQLQNSEDDYLPEYPGENDAYLNKRQKSSFVRIGKGKSSFVRVGRSVENLIDNLKEAENAGEAEKRMSSFVRIGKSDPEFLEPELNKRLSSFVRIGKGYNPEKRASSFVRIGRGGSKYLFKRPSSFVRIGKKSFYEGGPKRMSSFVRIGKSLPSNTYSSDPLTQEDKRQSSFVRIGKASPSSFVRIGKASPSSFVRIGKAAPSSFVRIGKAAPSSFVRIGKASPSSFVRIGKSAASSFGPEEGTNDGLSSFNEGTPDEEINKRMSNFVRIGRSSFGNKRSTSSFVRIGRQPSVKRLSSFVRIGKKSEFSPDEDSFGEHQQQELDPLTSDKRYSAFVRVGKATEGESSEDTSPYSSLEPEEGELNESANKRASSFVRIGKSYAGDLNSKRMSNFVRIGKRGGEGISADSDQLDSEEGLDGEHTSEH